MNLDCKLGQLPSFAYEFSQKKKKKRNCAPLVSANLLVVFLWNRFILPLGNGISVGTVQGFGLGFPGLGIAQAQSLVLCAQVDVKIGVEGPALAKCLQ